MTEKEFKYNICPWILELLGYVTANDIAFEEMGHLFNNFQPGTSRKVWEKIDDNNSCKIGKGDEMNDVISIIATVYLKRKALEKFNEEKVRHCEKFRNDIAGLQNFIYNKKMDKTKDALGSDEYQKHMDDWNIEYALGKTDMTGEEDESENKEGDATLPYDKDRATRDGGLWCHVTRVAGFKADDVIVLSPNIDHIEINKIEQVNQPMKMFYLENPCEYGHGVGDIIGGIDADLPIFGEEIDIDWLKFGQSANKFGDDTKDKIWRDTTNDDAIDMYNGIIPTRTSLVPLLMNNGVQYDRVWKITMQPCADWIVENEITKQDDDENLSDLYGNDVKDDKKGNDDPEIEGIRRSTYDESLGDWMIKYVQRNRPHRKQFNLW